ncbi:MAG: hypothetical protein JXQ87_14470 [Bacteroidia bacterium]
MVTHVVYLTKNRRLLQFERSENFVLELHPERSGNPVNGPVFLRIYNSTGDYIVDERRDLLKIGNTPPKLIGTESYGPYPGIWYVDIKDRNGNPKGRIRIEIR